MYFLTTSFYLALLLSAIVPVCGQTTAGGTGGDTCISDCSSTAAKQNLEAAKACLASTDENVEVACICNTLALRTALDSCIKATCPDQLATVDSACDSLTEPASATGSAAPATGSASPVGTGATPGGTDSTGLPPAGTASNPPGGIGATPPNVGAPSSSAPPAAVGTGGNGVGIGAPSGNAGGASGNGVGTGGSNVGGSSGGTPSIVGPNILGGAASRLGGSMVRSLITLAIAVASLL
ncbi:hypothetical protein EXIGLDRAFT_337882 [Exidia glandulosa HHB12029]|uniref:Extracellular membrane protein CFEM domain-containing protein n=1 Tax=Exidia glandulosa HHB12029 TaxID=1314781 RepID=A0A165LJC6_EXIGL|nr:hypothetical protein EXIGLDRAFT_337882 [Exidia glandulosa HHB12029]